MSIRGRWQVVETPGYDMASAGAYILFNEAGGEFAFDCLTGSIHGACHGDTVEFGWQGNDEMEPAKGDGWAELRDDGSLTGEICLLNGDDIPHSSRAIQRLLQQPALMFAVKTPNEHDFPGCAQTLDFSGAQSGRRGRDDG